MHEPGVGLRTDEGHYDSKDGINLEPHGQVEHVLVQDARFSAGIKKPLIIRFTVFYGATRIFLSLIVFLNLFSLQEIPLN